MKGKDTQPLEALPVGLQNLVERHKGLSPEVNQRLKAGELSDEEL